MTDPIADLLNRIRNAQAVNKPTVEIPYSDLKFEILKIMEKEGLVEKLEKKGKRVKRSVEVTLRYEDGAVPVISGLKRVSRPGQRIYLRVKEIRSVRGGYGFSIISTPKGLMSDKGARRAGIGGEVICEVW
ncbi:MAG: 30S ribosomal protein S8 [bacterium]